MDECIITDTLLLAEPGVAPPLADAFVHIQAGRIVRIGSMDALQPGWSEEFSGQVIDGRGQLTMPGLVNGHCHGAMTLFRGLADDLELIPWLQEYIFPAEAAHVSAEMVYHCSLLAAAEMLLSGTTCVADGYFLEDEATRAFAKAGIRAVAAQGVIDFPAPGVPDPQDAITAARAFLERWQGVYPTMQPAVFAHSPYTCSNTTLRACKDLSREKGVPLFIHLAENRAEQQLIANPTGSSPVRHLDNLGLLDSQTVCIHCVWLDEENLDILAARGARVVICPQSHCKLTSGMAPLAAMLERGIPVALGTDGAASNNGLDLFREMDLCAKMQKVRAMDPVAVPAGRILQMACSGAGLFHDGPVPAGVLTPGAAADLILLDLHSPHLTPFYNPELLVYAGQGRDVRTVMVNGLVVVEDRRLLTFDLEECMGQVRELARRVRCHA